MWPVLVRAGPDSRAHHDSPTSQSLDGTRDFRLPSCDGTVSESVADGGAQVEARAELALLHDPALFVLRTERRAIGSLEDVLDGELEIEVFSDPLRDGHVEEVARLLVLIEEVVVAGGAETGGRDVVEDTRPGPDRLVRVVQSEVDHEGRLAHERPHVAGLDRLDSSGRRIELRAGAGEGEVRERAQIGEGRADEPEALLHLELHAEHVSALRVLVRDELVRCPADVARLDGILELLEERAQREDVRRAGEHLEAEIRVEHGRLQEGRIALHVRGSDEVREQEGGELAELGARDRARDGGAEVGVARGLQHHREGGQDLQGVLARLGDGVGEETVEGAEGL